MPGVRLEVMEVLEVLVEVGPELGCGDWLAMRRRRWAQCGPVCTAGPGQWRDY